MPQQSGDLSLFLRLKATAKEWIAQVKAAGKAVKEELGGSLKSAERQADETSRSFSGFFSGIKLKALAAAIAVGAIGKKTLDAGRNIDELVAGLEIAEGSAEAAADTFARLEQASIDWRVGVDQLVDAYARLKNLGLDPSREALEAYLNIAAGTRGKALIDFAEAVADATVGEFERLKEFGIKAGIEGDKVVIRFKGQAIEIANSARDIERALQRIGETEFAGALERKAQTANAGFAGLAASAGRLLAKIDEKTGLTATLAALANGFTGIIDASTQAKTAIGGVREEIETLTVSDRINEGFDKIIDKIRALRGIEPIDFEGDDDEISRFNRLTEERLRLLERQRRLQEKIREVSQRTAINETGRTRLLQLYGAELGRIKEKLDTVTGAMTDLQDKSIETGKKGAAAMGEIASAAEAAGDALGKTLGESADALSDYVDETRELLGAFDEIARRYGSAGDEASLAEFWNAEGEAASELRRGNYEAAWQAVKRAREEFEGLADAGKLSETEVDIVARRLKDLGQDIAKGRVESGALFEADDTREEIAKIKDALEEIRNVGVNIDTSPVEAAIARLTGTAIEIPVVFVPQGGSGTIEGGGRRVTTGAGLQPGEVSGDGLVEGRDFVRLQHVDEISRASRAAGSRVP